MPTITTSKLLAAAGLLLAATSLPAQDDVKLTYAKLCSGCHGDDARGSQQGPGLAGNPWIRRRSAQALKNTIRNGVPSAGMPAFKNLSAETVDALTAMIVSLNAVAAETKVEGDPDAGRTFFTGQGQCTSCHMVNGEGSAAGGPDLSTVARELTVSQIREALQQPDARIAPGYEFVTASLPTGRKVEGFVRSRSSFLITIQTKDGVFRTLPLDANIRIADHKNSVMPPLKATPEDLRDLVAYLSRLTGPQTGATVQSAPKPTPGGPDFAQIQKPEPADWLTWNGNLNGNRYSPLKQINAANVSKLTLKWSYSIPLWSQFFPDTPYFRENLRYYGLETVPVVAKGIMYATGPNQIIALDAKTGHEIWSYSRPRTQGLVSDPSLGTNRGVAILGDNLFMVTDNAHLIAVNRITGRLVWEQRLWDEAQKYGGTMTPLIVKDMVIAGVSGGDWGIRGFVSAYKATTGERVWRHWTVPAPGEPGSETWKGTAIATGGAATWLTGSYDPETDTVFWATGNPWPNSDDRERQGDNLYTDSVLALDPATGERKWHFQFTPHDLRDWDANEPNVAVNTTWKGQPRKLLLHADRNGFFYVFDRTDGKLLLGEKFLRRLTWASGLDANGRPIRVPEHDVSCPDHATNWHGTAWSPTTRLYYIQATEKCVVHITPGSWNKERPKAPDQGMRYLRALDIETGRIVWDFPQPGPTDGKRVAGVLGTAGGLLFLGDATGNFVAVDERNGKPLWRLPLNATIKTSPMTFAVDGQQYIAIAAGANIMVFGLPQQ